MCDAWPQSATVSQHRWRACLFASVRQGGALKALADPLPQRHGILYGFEEEGMLPHALCSRQASLTVCQGMDAGWTGMYRPGRMSPPTLSGQAGRLQARRARAAAGADLNAEGVVDRACGQDEDVIAEGEAVAGQAGMPWETGVQCALVGLDVSAGSLQVSALQMHELHE